MRPLTKRDLTMLENVTRMLRQVNFRSLDFDEALGVSQTWGWIQGFTQDMRVSILNAENKVEVESALSTAVEVKPVVAPPEEKPKRGSK